ncbi:MAG: DUF2252 family protein [Janthinobacterium lividum]
MKKPVPTVQPADRAARLTALRREKMSESAHAYVRGSTVRFYEWLAAAGRGAIPEGPPVWICGDCHVGNLGPVASAGGALAVQIRDFDQTVVGNPAHDLVRLGLSLAMAARGSDLPGATTAHVVEHMMAGYEAAFAGDADVAVPETVRRTMRRAAGRSWRHLADERIEGTRAGIPLGPRFWPLEADERAAIDALFGREDLRALVTSLRARDDDAEVSVIDAAYWRKGCSSLGLLRCAVLVAVGHGRTERHCLIDLKEAVAAAAPRAEGRAMPRDNAERVVSGARALSPHLGERMLPLRMLDRAVFARELLPQDLKLEIESLTRAEAVEVATFLAATVGQAHARQMTPDERTAWLAELGRNRAGALDAPSWLWRAIVELVGTHESAYLDHCRKHALAA